MDDDTFVYCLLHDDTKYKHKLCHKHVCNEIETWVCNICNKEYKARKHAVAHINHMHIDGKKYYCYECDKRFYTKYRLIDHIDIHDDAIAYICYVCDKPLKTKRGVYHHVYDMHTGSRGKYKCNECGKYYMNKKCVTQHIKRKHFVRI